VTVLLVALAALGGYLLGSIPTGLIVGRAYRGVDVRDFGSGKTGFTNTLRSLGLGAALIVVAVDIAKGAVPVLVGRFLFDEPWAAAIGGAAAVLGHNWPLFAGFRGGRGVATAWGAFSAISPLAGAALLLVAAAVLGTTRYVSLMSIACTAAGFVALAVLVALDEVAAPYLLFAVIAAATIELSHVGNIRRLLAGVEPKLGQGGVPRAPRAPRGA
jgi:glycerol-3-phosphate acyltransferase PlsY